MNDADRIDLAHARDFTLGRLNVRPGTRELVRDDGATEVLEPRVMQVLVALARADGAIVTRDELSRWCWEGRVVGEDAINRVLSRLRRSAEGIGEGSFRIETITKVGYRLAAANGAPAPQHVMRAPANRFDRRMVIAAGAAAAAAAATAVLLPRGYHAAPAIPPEIAALMAQAGAAQGQSTNEGQNQAIALYRRVLAIMPNYADAWGRLGDTYAQAARFSATAECLQFRARADEAARRALAIDPDNVYGKVARAAAQPRLGNWLTIERSLRAALVEHPESPVLSFALANILGNVGRCAEALALMEQAMKRGPVSPSLVYSHIDALWAANRLEETDRALADAQALYPTHYAVWFTRFYVLMYTGRTSQAIAMAEDRDTRPNNIEDNEIDAVEAVARAIQTHDPAQVAAVTQTQLGKARKGAGYAENTIQFLTALGRLDDAFAVADALYFGRGFTVPELRFTAAQRSYSPASDRLTSFLFNPCVAPMWRDPRFDTLTRELGLARYWQESGSKPDYRK